MADNITITPGTGATVATDDIGGGVQVQRVKPAFGTDGTAVDVSATNPMPVTLDTGTLLSRVEELLLVTRQVLSGAGAQFPDGAGRTRVLMDTSSTITLSAATLATVTTVNQFGGVTNTLAVPALANGGFDSLRRGITVS